MRTTNTSRRNVIHGKQTCFKIPVLLPPPTPRSFHMQHMICWRCIHVLSHSDPGVVQLAGGVSIGWKREPLPFQDGSLETSKHWTFSLWISAPDDGLSPAIICIRYVPSMLMWWRAQNNNIQRWGLGGWWNHEGSDLSVNTLVGTRHDEEWWWLSLGAVYCSYPSSTFPYATGIFYLLSSMVFYLTTTKKQQSTKTCEIKGKVSFIL